MRKAPLVIAVSSLALIAGAAFAASSPKTGASSSASTASSAAAAPSANTGAAANTSATAGGFSVGETVRDNTGASIGTITDLKTDASGKQQAVIKMGTDQFSVATANLGQANGAATINLTQAQISKMLHPGGAADTPTPATPGGSTGGPAAGTAPSGTMHH